MEMDKNTSAVIITKDKETMDEVKELLKSKAKCAYNNISKFSTPTRIDIDEWFIVNSSEDEYAFYERLYSILKNEGACFFASSDSSVDPYTEVTYYINGEVWGIWAEGIEDTYINDIADWLKKWNLKITRSMADALKHLGIKGKFIIGDPSENKDIYIDRYDETEDEDIDEQE